MMRRYVVAKLDRSGELAGELPETMWLAVHFPRFEPEDWTKNRAEAIEWDSGSVAELAAGLAGGGHVFLCEEQPETPPEKPPLFSPQSIERCQQELERRRLD